MRRFSKEIVERLRSGCVGEPIEWVGLGLHQFQFAAGSYNVRCEETARFTIDGARFEWAGVPIEAPVWKFVGGEIAKVTGSEDVLSFTLSNGDQIEACTSDGPYEAVIVEAGDLGVLEVF